jgi:hypothetical protein
VTYARNLWADLVDKRLWPFALVLLVAIVAVPIALSKSAPSTPQGPSVPPAAAVANGAGVTLSNQPVAGTVTGPSRDPFAEPLATAGASAASLGTSAGTSTTSGSAAGGSGSAGGTTLENQATFGTPSVSSGSGSSSSGSSSTGTTTPSSSGTTQPAAPKPSTEDRNLTIRFGVRGTDRPRRTVKPRAALPSPSNPLLIYLGTTSGGKAAKFLVSSDVTPKGFGKCSPSTKVCSSITIKKGEPEFFDVTSNGQTVEYRLDILRIGPLNASSSATRTPAFTG